MEPSFRTRLRWRLEDLRDVEDGKVVAGLVVVLLLIFGGFFVARAVAHASTASATPPGFRTVTLRQKVRERVRGRLVTRWRLRTVYAKQQTVLETRTVSTPNGIRVVTHPVTRYRFAYRKQSVTVHGKTRTVLRPLTSTQTLTRAVTQLVTVTRPTQVATVTVTQPVTVVGATTVVSTQTDTVPVTVTVTLPTTTGLP